MIIYNSKDVLDTKYFFELGDDNLVNKKICVVGSGSGAFAVAGNLALAGKTVCLWDDEAFSENIEAIRQNGNVITVTGAALTGNAQLAQATTDLDLALTDTNIVLLVLPSFAFAAAAHKLAPKLRPGLKVYMCCGSTGGALEVAKIFADAGTLTGVKLGEFCTLPFGCKKTGPTSVRVNTHLKFNQFAAFPAKDTAALFPEIQELFPYTTPAKDVLECSLGNGNIVLHGPILLFNAAGTEGNPDNHHYRDGITPSVARAMDAFDAERMAVCRALGYDPISVAEATVKKQYCPRLEANSYLTYRGSTDFMTSSGPTTLNHRYMTEDIPYSALVVSVLGRLLSVPTPLTDAMITLCSALMGQDYWSCGRTAQAMGIESMTPQELRTFLKEGYSPGI